MAIGLVMFAAAAIAADTRYPSTGDCAGLPKIRVITPAGWCVGVVAQGLRFPRGITVLPNGDLVVAEIGAWTPNRGRLSILRKAKHYARETLFDGLDRPHGVALGPDQPPVATSNSPTRGRVKFLHPGGKTGGLYSVEARLAIRAAASFKRQLLPSNFSRCP